MPRGGFRVGAGKLRGDGWRVRQREKRLMSKKEPDQKICGHCGEIFTNKRLKYCSDKCCLSANHEKLTSFPHMCSKCGEKFNGLKGQKYCSDYCYKNKHRRTTENGADEKQCPSCGEWKPLTFEYWRRSKQGLDGFYGYCRICANKKSLAHSKTKHARLVRKSYRIKNADSIRETNRKSQKKMQPIYNKMARIRLRTDVKYNLNNRMRRLMWAGLKENKGGQKWQDLIGYSIDDLRRHIEKQFKGGMNWDRFLAGEIHIDHKIPRMVFNFSHPEHIDFKRCWALKNLQPMWAEENLIKGSKLDKHFQPSLAIGG